VYRLHCSKKKKFEIVPGDDVEHRTIGVSNHKMYQLNKLKGIINTKTT